MGYFPDRRLLASVADGSCLELGFFRPFLASSFMSPPLYRDRPLPFPLLPYCTPDGRAPGSFSAPLPPPLRRQYLDTRRLKYAFERLDHDNNGYLDYEV